MSKNPSHLDRPLFSQSPALRALSLIDNPRPDVLRACIMEITRILDRLDEAHGDLASSTVQQLLKDKKN